MQSSNHQTTIMSVNVNNQLQQKYQKCLQKLANPPKYQYIVGVFITIFYVLIVFNTMIGPFVYMNPIFQCNHNSETQQEACKHISECTITNDFTAVSKNNLYCDKQSIRTTIQSIFGFGYLIGKISFPLISDIIGRKKALLIALFMGITGMSTQLIGIQYNIEILMILGQLTAGIFGSGMYTLGIIYICDFCPSKIREVYLTTCWCIWGVGQMLFYVFYEYLNHWRFYISALLFIPAALIFILLLYFQIESPAYAIFVKKDFRMFKQIVKRLQFFNKFQEDQVIQIKIQGKQLIEQLKKQSKSQIHLKQALTKIFCNKKNFKTLICLVLTNVSYVFFYYGMQGSMESAGFSFGLNMLFIGITEGISFLLSGILTRNLKRKVSLIVTIVFSSIVGLLFLFQFVQNSKIMQTILVVLARLGSTYVFCFFLIMQSELLDVQIRSTCFSIIDGTGQLGRIAGPIVINIMYNLKTQPIIAFAIVFLVLGAFPVFFLKQTYKAIDKQNQNAVKNNLQESQNKRFSQT